MTAVEKLAENRRKQQELVQRHQEIGKKFQTFAAPHRKACDDKLRREKFPPFLAVEKAQQKASKAQTEVLSELEKLGKEHNALLAAFDAEMSGPPQAAPKVPLAIVEALPLEDAEAEPEPEVGPEIPELDL